MTTKRPATKTPNTARRVEAGTREKPWTLATPPGTSQYLAFREPLADPPALVVQVGKTELRYHLRCIDDLHTMLTQHGDWMALGSADEQKLAVEGTVEAWALGEESGQGLVRAQEGPSRPVRRVLAPGARSARARRGGAPGEGQPDAGEGLIEPREEEEPR